ncbi:hypothetical protein GCM10027176_18530 [Actinoallomurus bryophytorum]|uniref:Uncharacterized protein n=1 Tax=Actinoallomurus bryophytorum TaxID=1490222 RepID=A0A543CL87_9ACTN|nr:hypothetical protein [Actinoallomurus bryophytorum]TQL97863.1 hypothetical protein FB559_3472 [Actinoallomurus bryophytorum]
MVDEQLQYLERICFCGERYRATSRGEGGPFHFRVMRVTPVPGGKAALMGHWRSGDWNQGEMLELRRRDGHTLAIADAEMTPAVDEASAIRGQRTILVADHRSLQPQSCIWAISSDRAAVRTMPDGSPGSVPAANKSMGLRGQAK